MSGIGLPARRPAEGRMHWLQSRQKVLAENVANADTPGFKPQDLGRCRARAATGAMTRHLRRPYRRRRAAIGPTSARNGEGFETCRPATPSPSRTR